MRGSITQVTLCFFLLISLIGCSGGPSVVRVKASIEAADGLNPDPGGRPSPVVVRLYQLRSPNPFETADFFALYDNEVATLGQTLVRRQEFELQPGSERDYSDEMDPTTKYVGVIAAFRDLDNARWRSIVQLRDKKKVYLRIDLDSLAVSVSTGKR